jgi:cytochrome oxidase Cu insertion factor (SCO1/SenC/PrrC family)
VKRALASAAAALTLVVGVAAAGAGPDFAAFGLQPYEPPKAAPDFTLPDVDGRPRSLGDFRGKVLLLFFWATW